MIQVRSDNKECLYFIIMHCCCIEKRKKLFSGEVIGGIDACFQPLSNFIGGARKVVHNDIEAFNNGSDCLEQVDTITKDLRLLMFKVQNIH